MKAWLAKWAWLGGLALVLAAGWYFGPQLIERVAAEDAEQVPTLEVARSDFERTVVAEGTVEAVKATRMTAPNDARMPLKVAWLIEDGSKVQKDQVVVRFDPTDFERELENGRSDRAMAAGEANKQRRLLDQSMRTKDESARIAKLELERTRKFQSKDEEIFSRHQIVESAIDERLSTARLEHADATKKIEKRVASTKLALVGVRQRAAEQRIQRAKDGLGKLEVKAPHTGIVVLRRGWTGVIKVGDTTWPGRPVAEIPLTDEMQAEAFVLEADAGEVAEGQDAEVIVESAPERRFKAKVKHIDKLAKPRVRQSPVQYFGVKLELEQTDKELMKPGARVRANISVGADDAIVVPRQAVAEVGGKFVVFKRFGISFYASEVELGASTPGRVVITKGLEPGDRIAMRDPRAKSEDVDGQERGGPPKIGGAP
ncbi:MAG: efflux RND transporter periplasmic adaptor subunit [Deltaproteobacteria bacterium]|nr:efflux RND transporter periplasmic adaptor subunit [Deltaproteobacteria bacterium]